jgi:hypothetical protein
MALGPGGSMIGKFFGALYVGLFGGMVVLYITNFFVAWIFFAFVFVTIWGGILMGNRHRALLAACFLAPSLAVLGFGAVPLAQALQASAWPKAPAIIQDEGACPGNLVCVFYDYRIEGETYHGREGYNFPGLASGGLDGFRHDQEVLVHYNPRDPRLSRLTAHVTLRDGSTTLIGGVMTLLAAATLAAIWLTPKKSGKNKPPRP